MKSKANKKTCRYGEHLTVVSHTAEVDLQQEFSQDFIQKLINLILDRVLEIISALRQERCLNLTGRRSLHVRRLNTRYGYNVRHAHAHVEIAMVLHGSCRFLMNDRVYSCRAGDVVFVPPYQPHVDAYERADTGYELLWFLLYENRYSVSWTGFAASGSSHALSYFYRKRIVTIPLGNVPAWGEWHSEKNFSILVLRELLLYLCYRTVMVLRRAPAKHSSRVLAVALDRINRDFAGTVRLGELARVLDITPNYLSALFTRLLGLTFKQYLLEVRLAHAQLLLKNPLLSIKEVMRDSGFGSIAAFDRLFSQVYGMPPTQYRDSITSITAPAAPRK